MTRFVTATLLASLLPLAACATDESVPLRKAPDTAGGKTDGTQLCGDVGGSCYYTWNAANSPPACEGAGLFTVDAQCGGIGTTCCVTTPPAAPTCADLGGQCMASQFFPTSAPSCEQEFGLETADGECALLNQSCCIPPPPPPSCADLGGQCKVSQFFPTSAPSCEQEFSLVTADGECALLNESCCIPPAPTPATCEAAGGECHTSLTSTPPGCGQLDPVAGACPQSNQSCCELTVVPL